MVAFADIITFARSTVGFRRNASGNLESVSSGNPRIDHDPLTLEALGLLIEESSANSAQYNEDLRNTADAGSVRPWTYRGMTLSANATTAPDGNVTADLIIEDSSTGLHGIDQAVSVSAGTYTFSAFVKYAGRQWVRLDPFGTASAGTDGVWFDIVNGIKGTEQANCTGTITPAKNGFYLLTWTGAVSTGVLEIALRGADADGSSANYTGSGGNAFYAWGIQLEPKARRSSYMQTTGSTFTRTAETADITGSDFSDWFNAAEGTFVIEADTPDTSTTRTILYISNGTAAERMRVLVSTAVEFSGSDGGVTQWTLSAGSVVSDEPVRIAVAYKANDIALCVNGGSVQRDTSASLPTVDRLRIGADVSGATYLNGHIRRIRYWPTRLDDQILQDFTA